MLRILSVFEITMRKLTIVRIIFISDAKISGGICYTYKLVLQFLVYLLQLSVYQYNHLTVILSLLVKMKLYFISLKLPKQVHDNFVYERPVSKLKVIVYKLNIPVSKPKRPVCKPTLLSLMSYPVKIVAVEFLNRYPKTPRRLSKTNRKKNI